MTFRWYPRTLRSRLALWYSVSGTLMLVAFSAAIYTYVARSTARPLDYDLRRDLAAVRTRLNVTTAGDLRWNGRELDAPGSWNARDPWFELWDEGGRLLHRAWGLGDVPDSQTPLPPLSESESLAIIAVGSGGAGQEVALRSLTVPYEAPGIPRGWMLRIFRVHTPAEDALEALLWIIAVALPIMIAALVVGGYAITRRWLMPLDQMVAEANHITADNLSRRLTVSEREEELGKLAAVFNITLDRLESAFGDLDRFVGDAAHELRSPLTAMRAVGEVGLQRERSDEEYREIIGSMLEEEHRLQSLVHRLLELAGAESKGRAEHRKRVRLDELAANCVEELSVLAENRSQLITLKAKKAETVTDPVLVRQALHNLVDNALKYSPDGSTIEVELRDDGTRYILEVRDQGPGIEPEHSKRLTERFFRAGRSGVRGRDGGFGLGLSITKVYMRVLGGALLYERRPEGGSCFGLAIPKSTKAPEAVTQPRPAASPAVTASGT